MPRVEPPKSSLKAVIYKVLGRRIRQPEPGQFAPLKPRLPSYGEDFKDFGVGKASCEQPGLLYQAAPIMEGSASSEAIRIAGRDKAVRRKPVPPSKILDFASSITAPTSSSAEAPRSSASYSIRRKPVRPPKIPETLAPSASSTASTASCSSKSIKSSAGQDNRGEQVPSPAGSRTSMDSGCALHTISSRGDHTDLSSASTLVGETGFCSSRMETEEGKEILFELPTGEVWRGVLVIDGDGVKRVVYELVLRGDD